jgi:hypothetical protein
MVKVLVGFVATVRAQREEMRSETSGPLLKGYLKS